jgi:Rps23 Pro-64 3,4-dihydroxylase Tpa1-like proline 4-hydroxylase
MDIKNLTLPVELGQGIRCDEKEARSLGEFFQEDYKNAEPFPHIVIDDFLPEEFIKSIHDAFPAQPLERDKVFDINYGGHHKRQIQPESCPDYLRQVFHFFNSAPVLQFLEGLTGITGLLPDPYFSGGGLHETSTGGKLGIHADFRINNTLHVERRLNLLVYLNPTWDDHWMGQLELWDRQMTQCVSKVSPVWNRCVIFSTDADSYHGHPDELQTPPEVKRRSMALYYYTASKAIYQEVPNRSTMYQARPGDSEAIHKEARQFRMDEYMRDWLPPVALRAVNAVKRRLSK